MTGSMSDNYIFNRVITDVSKQKKLSLQGQIAVQLLNAVYLDIQVSRYVLEKDLLMHSHLK